MGRYVVTTPVAGHTGPLGAVHFVDGRAVIDEDTHPAELAYCRAREYAVEPLSDAPAAGAGEERVDEPGAPAEMPKKSASTEAWRAYAVDHGGMTADEAAEMSRDQLVERFTTATEGSGQ
jgi:hypothetical protein